MKANSPAETEVFGGETHQNDGKVCFFAFLYRESNEARVRFGLTRRPESQILTSLDSWRRIRELLESDGYVIEEATGGNAVGRAAVKRDNAIREPAADQISPKTGSGGSGTVIPVKTWPNTNKP